MARILVIDDDSSIRATISLALSHAGHRPVEASSVEEARKALQKERPDLVLSDIYMPGGDDGIALLQELRGAVTSPPVILMTARGTIETATVASRVGAFDYLAKPFSIPVLLDRIACALSPPSPVGADIEASPPSAIIGAHPAMVEIYKAVSRIAPMHVSVLLSGETGTGKELVARALHDFSPRAEGPFIAVNCAAIPDTLLESELFGHVRGAFTDARRDRRGALARAHGGTAFLDEIGDVSASFQVKLLRFLQDGVVAPVGAEKGEKVDVRVVAATNRDLPSMIRHGVFRQDLYYRLTGYDIRIPPLRDRRSDLPLLVQHFARKEAHDLGMAEHPVVTTEVLDVLQSHDWPGNVRELEQVVRRLLIDTGGLWDAPALRRILSHLPQPADGVSTTSRPLPLPAGGDDGPDLVTLEEAERRHVIAVLEACGGNRTRAAGILGIERKTLGRKLSRWGAAAPSANEEETDETEEAEMASTPPGGSS